MAFLCVPLCPNSPLLTRTPIIGLGLTLIQYYFILTSLYLQQLYFQIKSYSQVLELGLLFWAYSLTHNREKKLNCVLLLTTERGLFYVLATLGSVLRLHPWPRQRWLAEALTAEARMRTCALLWATVITMGRKSLWSPKGRTKEACHGLIRYTLGCPYVGGLTLGMARPRETWITQDSLSGENNQMP